MGNPGVDAPMSVDGYCSTRRTSAPDSGAGASGDVSYARAHRADREAERQPARDYSGPSIMKAIAIAVAALVFLTALPIGQARAGELVTEDGTWWQGLPDGTKVFVVQALIDSIDTTYGIASNATGNLVLRTINADENKPCLGVPTCAQLSLNLTHLLLGRSGKSAPIFSKTFGTYVDEMNDFYIRHPEFIQWSVTEVLYCLSDTPGSECARFPK